MEIGPLNLLRNIGRTLAQYRTFRATFAELQGCSDRQLADMGFARGDLTRVAYEAAELRQPVAARAAARAPLTGAFAGRAALQR